MLFFTLYAAFHGAHAAISTGDLSPTPIVVVQHGSGMAPAGCNPIVWHETGTCVDSRYNPDDWGPSAGPTGGQLADLGSSLNCMFPDPSSCDTGVVVHNHFDTSNGQYTRTRY